MWHDRKGNGPYVKWALAVRRMLMGATGDASAIDRKVRWLPNDRRAPGAFTMIEVVVAIAIIAVLIALLVPAVQSARAAARRLECASHLRQLHLAIEQYQGVHGQLPIGSPIVRDADGSVFGQSVLVSVLPYLENQVIYHAYNLSLRPQSTSNLTVELSRPSLYVCPSDPLTIPVVSGGTGSRYPELDPPSGPWPMSLTSYGLMYGSLDYQWRSQPDASHDPLGQQNGCFNDQQRITLASITDGLSNTIYASERALGHINLGCSFPLGQWTNTEGGTTLVYSWLAPNSLFKYWPVDVFRTSTLPAANVSSFHGGGANVLFGDGGVRFVKDSIESWQIDPETMSPVGIIHWFDGFKNVPRPGVWQALATRAGGETATME